MVSFHNLMNIFLPDKPRIAIFINERGYMERIATNISPSIQIENYYSDKDFEVGASDLSFEIDNQDILF